MGIKTFFIITLLLLTTFGDNNKSLSQQPAQQIRPTQGKSIDLDSIAKVKLDSLNLYRTEYREIESTKKTLSTKIRSAKNEAIRQQTVIADLLTEKKILAEKLQNKESKPVSEVTIRIDGPSISDDSTDSSREDTRNFFQKLFGKKQKK